MIICKTLTVYKIHMAIRAFILTLIICVLVFAAPSCRPTPAIIFKVAQLDTTIKVTKVPVTELADSYKKYQGQHIEITGEFYCGFEQFAIYVGKDLLTNRSHGFWLDLDKDLDIDYGLFEKMSGKPITVKGMIDTTEKGHLGAYLATIKKIYYWKQE